MKIYTYTRKLFVNTTLEEAWNFFSNPINLCKITPKEMNFEITNEIPYKIYPGLIITYKVTPLPLIRVSWVTEIKQAKENTYFIDEQRFGPYKFWYHIHFFRPMNQGVEMEDIVYYGLPFGYVGVLFGSKLVQKQLKRIFDFREQQISQIFNKS